MTTTTPILTANALVKSFRRSPPRGPSFLAVDNVSLTLFPGEFVTLVGRSGSDKTTLINLLSGLLTPTPARSSLTAVISMPFRNLSIPVSATRS